MKTEPGWPCRPGFFMGALDRGGPLGHTRRFRGRLPAAPRSLDINRADRKTTAPPPKL